MTGSAKAKGDMAEREAAQLLAGVLGFPVHRRGGAGQHLDRGDLDGIPGTVVQVANWADTAKAAQVKPVEANAQAANAGAVHAMTMIRFRGGTWRVVLTVEQWAGLWREAFSPCGCTGPER